MKQLFLGFLAVLFFFSCSQDTLLENGGGNGSVDDVSTKETLLIDKTSVYLDSGDARNVAFLFRFGNNPKTRSLVDVALEDLTVQTVTDVILNVPLLYVVNWGNNNGYIVVSANKKSTPVVAFADTGSFDPEIDLASKSYIEGYKDQVREAYKDMSDSLRLKYALEWSVFEKTELDSLSAKTRTSGTNIDQMIQDEINKKIDLGYTYIGKITGASHYLPADEYQALIMDVSTHTDPAYDYEEVSLFFIKSFNHEQIGPLMGTKWHQGEPFNVDAPNNIAGCVPIAVAQIAYYHKYPAKYNWSEIYPNPILNSAFKYFITDIRNLCRVEYESDGTQSNYDKAYKAFQSLGYVVNKGGLPDFIKLRNEIKARNPVYIRGENYLGDNGHAWVCEGYQNIRYEGVISMIADSKYGPTRANASYTDYSFFVYPPSSLDQDLYGEFYYMNMGWGGINNGWYRANSYKPSDPENSFIKDQKIITVKK